VNTPPGFTDDQCYAAALACLEVAPATLRALLDGYHPRSAWEAITQGRHRIDPGKRLRAKAGPSHPAGWPLRAPAVRRRSR
jgi:hypothetical protein